MRVSRFSLKFRLLFASMLSDLAAAGEFRLRHSVFGCLNPARPLGDPLENLGLPSGNRWVTQGSKRVKWFVCNKSSKKAGRGCLDRRDRRHRVIHGQPGQVAVIGKAEVLPWIGISGHRYIGSPEVKKVCTGSLPIAIC